MRHEDSPIPTIRAKEILDNMLQGEIVKVITSKESTIKNIKTLVINNPFNLIIHRKTEEGYVFYIEKQ
jgi:TusA-related sulfurtransferase